MATCALTIRIASSHIRQAVWHTCCIGPVAPNADGTTCNIHPTCKPVERVHMLLLHPHAFLMVLHDNTCCTLVIAISTPRRTHCRKHIPLPHKYGAILNETDRLHKLYYDRCTFCTRTSVSAGRISPTSFAQHKALIEGLEPLPRPPLSSQGHELHRLPLHIGFISRWTPSGLRQCNASAEKVIVGRASKAHVCEDNNSTCT